MWAMAEITLEDVIAFIRDKWKVAECPRCGVNSWSGAPGQFLAALLPLGKEDIISVWETNAALKLFWMACDNCGHVELMMHSAVDKWKTEKGG
jgi:hypothetical protein